MHPNNSTSWFGSGSTRQACRCLILCLVSHDLRNLCFSNIWLIHAYGLCAQVAQVKGHLQHINITGVEHFASAGKHLYSSCDMSDCFCLPCGIENFIRFTIYTSVWCRMGQPVTIHWDVSPTSCQSRSDWVQTVQWEGGKICRFTVERATAFKLLVNRCWQNGGVKKVLEQTYWKTGARGETVWPEGRGQGFKDCRCEDRL